MHRFRNWSQTECSSGTAWIEITDFDRINVGMVTHTLTAEAPGSREPWTRLWTWQSLRYRGSGWWLDRMLPHSPAAFLVAVVALPLVWFGCGIALADDAEAQPAMPYESARRVIPAP